MAVSPRSLHELGAVGAAGGVGLDGAELVAAEAAVAGFAHSLRNTGDGVPGDAVGAIDGDLLAVADGEDVAGFEAGGNVGLQNLRRRGRGSAGAGVAAQSRKLAGIAI